MSGLDCGLYADHWPPLLSSLPAAPHIGLFGPSPSADRLDTCLNMFPGESPHCFIKLWTRLIWIDPDLQIQIFEEIYCSMWNHSGVLSKNSLLWSGLLEHLDTGVNCRVLVDILEILYVLTQCFWEGILDSRFRLEAMIVEATMIQ